VCEYVVGVSRLLPSKFLRVQVWCVSRLLASKLLRV